MAIGINTSDADVWRKKAEALHWAGRDEESLQAYEEVARIEPTDADTWSTIGDSLWQVASSMIQCRLMSAPLDWIRDPSWELRWSDTGHHLLDYGLFNESMKAFERALEMDPESYDCLKLKGDALAGLERYDEALSAYNSAIDANESYAEAWFGKGKVFEILARNDEAIAAYDRAIEKDPQCEYGQVPIQKGRLLQRLKRYDEALLTYNEALDIAPEEYSAWLAKGDVLKALGRYRRGD